MVIYLVTLRVILRLMEIKMETGLVILKVKH